MATASDAYAVKSLNKSPGRRRFTFKTFSERIEDVDVDVYRSLDPLKAEPSEGIKHWRGFYFILRGNISLGTDTTTNYTAQEQIVAKLLSRLDMKGRLSLEPILRLIGALSRDLLEDFLPFLPRIADSLACLLKGGADREPDIIEQIFKSWSFIMMYLQKYLVKDVVDVLKVTIKLRYYLKEYVHEFMADSISFILRNAPVKQLMKDLSIWITVKPRGYLSKARGWFLCRPTRPSFFSLYSIVIFELEQHATICSAFCRCGHNSVNLDHRQRLPQKNVAGLYVEPPGSVSFHSTLIVIFHLEQRCNNMLCVL